MRVRKKRLSTVSSSKRGRVVKKTVSKRNTSRGETTKRKTEAPSTGRQKITWGGAIAGTYSSSLSSMPTQLSVPYYSHCYSRSRISGSSDIPTSSSSSRSSGPGGHKGPSGQR